MLTERGHAARQLRRNACNKVTCVAHMSIVLGEEEAGSQAILLKVFTGHGARNSRLSRASQPVQPEDISLVLSVSPGIYISEKGNTGILKADRVMLPLVCVEICVYGIRQSAEESIRA